MVDLGSWQCSGTGIAVANNNRRVISEGLLFSKLLTIFDAFKTAQIDFYTAHFHFTTAQFVINCTLKYALDIRRLASGTWPWQSAHYKAGKRGLYGPQYLEGLTPSS